MKQDNSIQMRLVAASPNDTKKTLTIPRDTFHRNVVFAGDLISHEIIIQQAESLFDMEHGGDINRLQSQQQELDAKYKASNAHRAELEQQLHQTTPFIETHLLEGISDEKDD